jgi:hypothetical protein
LRSKYFSMNGCPSASNFAMSIILSPGSVFMANSQTACESSGVRTFFVKEKCQYCMGNQSEECGDWEILTSIPHAIVLLFARKTSHWCRRVVFRAHSLWNSSFDGALWK